MTPQVQPLRFPNMGERKTSLRSPREAHPLELELASDESGPWALMDDATIDDSESVRRESEKGE